ncbi:uncharacterized protein LOC132201863 [Neocloeon triangulifer]|uniref:uncharacterized protein LOC132201863 n=1 Tax=Neocloeon triangulifer TaxID=2078957 RepID=UPI00286F1A1B|nr:uncharacterized protein LOC132201863 [Neocloeon triangulifer]
MSKLWRHTRVRAEGKIIVALEDQATKKNCVNCIINTALAEMILSVVITKNGKPLDKVDCGENLQGRRIEVAAIRYPPFITYPECGLYNCSSSDVIVDEELIGKLDGTEFRILQHLSVKFGFGTRLLLRQQSELWGMVYDNDTASGVIGMIKNGTVHVGIGGFNWDLRFFAHVDQLAPYRRTLVKFLSPRRDSSANWLSLVHPFNLDIWLSIALVVLAAATCLYLALRVEIGPSAADFVLTLLVSLSVLAQQGDIPRYWMRGVRRPILVGFQLCMILLGACYCAFLVAVLTSEQTAEQIDTVEELVDSNLRLTDVDDLWPGQLQLSKDPNIIKIMSRFEMSESWENLMNRLNSKRFSYTIECLDNGFLCLQDDMPEELLERLHLSKDFVLTSEIAMVWAKGFPLKNAFDREISHLIESGILHLWEEQVIASLSERDQHLGILMRRRDGGASVQIALGLSHMGGPFMLLIFGLNLALISFCFEHFYFRKAGVGKS